MLLGYFPFLTLLRLIRNLDCLFIDKAVCFGLNSLAFDGTIKSTCFGLFEKVVIKGLIVEWHGRIEKRAAKSVLT
jgi:hypothetical protein